MTTADRYEWLRVAATEAAARHGATLCHDDGVWLTRSPRYDGYTMHVRVAGIEAEPLAIPLDAEALCVAEDRDPGAFADWLYEQIKTPIVAYVARHMAATWRPSDGG